MTEGETDIGISLVSISFLGEYKPIKIMLLAGGDLVQSFAAPDVWATADVRLILPQECC